MRSYIAIGFLIALSACGDDGQSGPGGVPPNDAKALEEAAEMVEQGRPQLPVEQTEPAAEPAEAAEPTEDSKNESGED